MPSICLSCIIYTIYDKQIEENKYVTIFLLWLSQLIKVGGLTKDDMLHMYIDKRTIEYLFNNSIFGKLLSKISFQNQIFGDGRGRVASVRSVAALSRRLPR